MMHKDPNNRRASFKLPPPRSAQESRRQAALEQQRKRREIKIETFRNSDFFSHVAIPVDDESPSPPTDDSSIDLTLPPPDHPFSPPKSDSSQPQRTKAHRYANKLMYAEVLEFQSDDMGMDGMAEDGLPSDLETEWIALGPVPVGKRCMAVTYATNSGYGVIAPPAITALHSRASGHIFLRFSSPLPPDTILDCILDSHWQDTGILHVLDVMRWRGSDLSTCEAEFRLWFLQARLAEFSPQPPTTVQPYKHPQSFVQVPFWLPPLTGQRLVMEVVPGAKAGRVVPVLAPMPSPGPVADTIQVDEYGRALPGAATSAGFFAGGAPGPRETHIPSDGLLLYMKTSTYMSGSTPLCCWVPNKALEGESESRLEVFERLIRARQMQGETPFVEEVQMGD